MENLTASVAIAAESSILTQITYDLLLVYCYLVPPSTSELPINLELDSV